MDLDLTEEQEMIVGMVRRFVREEILPLELNLDPDAEELHPDDHDRLVGLTRDMGLYGLGIPPEYGGPDVDLVTRTLLAIEMAQHRAGLYAPCYGTFGGAGLDFHDGGRLRVYAESVRRLLAIDGLEVNLPNHPGMGRIFGKAELLGRREPKDPHPFVAPEELRAWLQERLARARQKLSTDPDGPGQAAE